MKKMGVVAFVAFLMVSPAMASFTVATFADPSATSANPLFTVDLAANTITGGWADSKTGLDLYIPGSGTFTDAFFTFASTYTGLASGGVTGGGTIKFFKDNQDTTTAPLIQIDFAKGYVNPYGLGAIDEFFADGVVITGTEVSGTLSDESFSFSFANQKSINGNWNNGFTATAAFTSSAIPEPATMAIFGIGAMLMLRLRKRA